MAFGQKTLAALLANLNEDQSMSTLDLTNNVSVRMQATQALQQLVGPLKVHPSIKTLTLRECEITDGCCEYIAELLADNHVIEILDLQKNRITSEGAGKIADGLSKNRSLHTLDLTAQASQFGEECLARFLQMYETNLTLTKIKWRLNSNKAWALSKLMTRNVEIQKRIASGKDYTELLPTGLREGRSPSPEPAHEEPKEPAPVAKTPAKEPAKTPAKEPAAEAKAPPKEQPKKPEPKAEAKQSDPKPPAKWGRAVQPKEPEPKQPEPKKPEPKAAPRQLEPKAEPKPEPKPAPKWGRVATKATEPEKPKQAVPAAPKAKEPERPKQQDPAKESEKKESEKAKEPEPKPEAKPQPRSEPKPESNPEPKPVDEASMDFTGGYSNEVFTNEMFTNEVMEFSNEVPEE